MAVLPSNRVDTGAISDHLKHTIARDKLMGRIGLCWGLGLMVAVIALIEMSGSFGLFRPVLPSISLAASTGGGYLILALFALAVGGVGLALTRYRPQAFFGVMVAGTAAVVILSIMGLRNGWAMSGSTVVIRPAEFWKPDKFFKSTDVTSVRRGCYISSVKGVGPSYNPIFIVNYDDGGNIDSWDSRQSFTSQNSSPANIAQFVDAIEAFRLKSGIPSETIGAAFIEKNRSSEAGQRVAVEERQCVAYFTRILDAKRASEFRGIVGAE